MIAPDLAARGDALRAAVDEGAALLAVCGGYQLLGRGYRGRDGSWLPGAALFPHETVAGETRMIGDVLLESTLAEAPGDDDRRLREPRGPNAARRRGAAARPGRRRVRERRRRRASRAVASGARSGRTSTARSAAQPVARRPAPLLGARACHRAGTGAPRTAGDELEHEAHAVAAARARARGGRPA